MSVHLFDKPTGHVGLYRHNQFRNDHELDHHEITDYTEPLTVDVDEVCANINHAYQQRGHQWDDTLSWPNVTVKAMADRIAGLEARLSDKDRRTA